MKNDSGNYSKDAFSNISDVFSKDNEIDETVNKKR